MDHRERSEHSNQVPIPEGCDRLGKELVTLQWVTTSIALSHRIPSSKRRDALVSALTAMLEDPQLESYDLIIAGRRKALSDYQDQGNKLELLKAELALTKERFPGVESILKDYPELTDDDGNLRFHLITKVRYRIWYVFTLIMGFTSTLFLYSLFLKR